MSRKEKRYHFIYKTTNLISNKYYVGMHSTNNLNDGYLGSGDRLKRSIKRNGKENFKLEIIEFHDDRYSLSLREAELVNDDLLKDPMCLNLRLGGTGGFSLEQQKINSKRGSQKFLELIKDDKWRANQIEKMKKGSRLYFSNNDGNFKNKKHSELSKQKISEANKISLAGTGNSQYGTCWITNDVLNKKILKTDNLPDGWHYGRVIKK